MTTNLNVVLNSFLKDIRQLYISYNLREADQLYTSVKNAFGFTDTEMKEMLKTLPLSK
jgi:hypothetical protein